MNISVQHRLVFFILCILCTETAIASNTDELSVDISSLTKTFQAVMQKDKQNLTRLLEEESSYPSALNSFVHVAKVLNYSWLGQCEQAHQLLQTLHRSSWYISAMQAVSHCFFKQDNQQQAEEIMLLMLDQESNPSNRCRLWWMYGRLNEINEKYAQAQKNYRKVWTTCPTSRLSKLSLEKLIYIKQNFKITYKQKSLIEKEYEADQYAGIGKYKTALKLYKKLLRHHRQRNNRIRSNNIRLSLAELASHLGKYHSTLKYLSALEKNRPTNHQKELALLLKAEILARKKRTNTAVSLLHKIVSDSKDLAMVCEGAWRLASLSFKTGKQNRSQDIITKYFTATTTHSDALCTQNKLQHKAIWTQAWTYFENNQLKPAFATLYESTQPREADQLYWSARWFQPDGSSLHPENLYKEILTKEKLSYYALAAAQNHTGQHPLQDIQIQQTDFTDIPASHPDIRVAKFLISHHLEKLAKFWLKPIKSHTLSPVDRLALASIYHSFDDYYRTNLYSRGSIYSIADNHPHFPAYLELAYPVPYAKEIKQFSKKFNIPAALIYGIIYQESAFNKKAFSNRQARGLMQLIVPTARSMARLERIRHFRKRMLFDPQYNIRLGTRYLKELAKRYNHEPILIIAAYHAGEKAVDRWLKRNRYAARDVFIEKIPYESTRNYVKVVLAAYQIYASLYYPNQLVNLELQESFSTTLVKR